jgi:hypothetical protein
MASYTHTELYGSGSIGENLVGYTRFEFNNPSGSSYFTMKPYLPLLVFMKLVPLKTLLEPI